MCEKYFASYSRVQADIWIRILYKDCLRLGCFVSHNILHLCDLISGDPFSNSCDFYEQMLIPPRYAPPPFSDLGHKVFEYAHLPSDFTPDMAKESLYSNTNMRALPLIELFE